jgi:hypothetical protein
MIWIALVGMKLIGPRINGCVWQALSCFFSNFCQEPAVQAQIGEIAKSSRTAKVPFAHFSCSIVCYGPTGQYDTLKELIK